MDSQRTLLLSRREVASLLTLEECIEAVERAFQQHAEEQTLPPAVLGVASGAGGFHIKTARLSRGRPYFAAKVNANFPDNRERFGLPTIQGVIVLCDGETGSLLALMDSIEITIQRTGAATAVAAKHLAREDSKVATICGCGNQGRIQLRALRTVRPLERAYAFDLDRKLTRRFAQALTAELGIDVRPADDLSEAVRRSDICVTCTPSKRAFLSRQDVAPGTFVAAVGADNPEKQELDPELMASSKIVVDILEQAATIGDLHHALERGLLRRADVHAELAEVVSGRKTGRTSADETIIFDSTGTALQDAAAAALVYEKALREGIGSAFNLSR